MKALKWLVFIPLVVFAGCSNQQSWMTSANMPTSSIALETPMSDNSKRPMYESWLSPSMVTISNFHAGAMAEYPMEFHNAKQTATDQKRVTTEINETIAEIPLSSAGLYQNDINNVEKVLSDNPKENLQVKAYDSKNNSILISGFLPNTTRILTIRYRPLTNYMMFSEIPDFANVKYARSLSHIIDYINIPTPTMAYAPLETKYINVSISLPSDVDINKFKFISVAPQAQLKLQADNATIPTSAKPIFEYLYNKSVNPTYDKSKPTSDNNTPYIYSWDNPSIYELSQETGLDEKTISKIASDNRNLIYISNSFELWVAVAEVSHDGGLAMSYALGSRWQFNMKN